jgi:hypothetical protein
MELSGQLHFPGALLRAKSPRYPLDRSLGGPPNRSGLGDEEEKSHDCPCRESNPVRLARSLVNTDGHPAPLQCQSTTEMSN